MLADEGGPNQRLTLHERQALAKRQMHATHRSASSCQVHVAIMGW